jgi:hypothetical protein
MQTQRFFLLATMAALLSASQSANAANIATATVAKKTTAVATTTKMATAKAATAATAKVATTVTTKAVTTPCATPAPTCPQPCISYRNGIGSLCAYGCKPPVQTVLTVKDPCTCCEVQVPVCIPACCTGEPTVGCKNTIIGRGVVFYDWCGFSVAVRFDRCGNVLVTYRG